MVAFHLTEPARVASIPALRAHEPYLTPYAGCGLSRCMRFAVWIMGATFALLLASCGSARGTQWQEFTSQDGGYTVSFPCRPKTRVEQFGFRVGMARCDVPFGGRSFGVDHFDYPKEDIDPEDEDPADTVLDLQVEYLTEGVNAKVIGETRITHEGHPGREVEFRRGNHFMHVRLIFVNWRV